MATSPKHCNFSFKLTEQHLSYGGLPNVSKQTYMPTSFSSSAYDKEPSFLQTTTRRFVYAKHSITDHDNFRRLVTRPK